MGGTSAGRRRLARGHRRRRVLVHSTGVFSWRHLMRRGIVLTVLMAIGGLSLAAVGSQGPGQGGPSPQALQATQIQQVKDNLYMITGSDPTNREAFSGGNTGVFLTDNGR